MKNIKPFSIKYSSMNIAQCIFILMFLLNHNQLHSSIIDADNDGLPNTEECTFTNLSDIKGFPEGIYQFDFGSGPFKAYVDGDGWILWLQYHHLGGTNPELNLIQSPSNLPMYDDSGLGTDNSADLTKWGHGSQDFAGFIPDENIKLRWYGVTSAHNRTIHFESAALGDFRADVTGNFMYNTPINIAIDHILYPDHTANIPALANDSSNDNDGDYALTYAPFNTGSNFHWILKGRYGNGARWEVDDYPGNPNNSTIHRVWVKSDDTANTLFCDTDGDGIPNVLDPDSDNDGINDGTDNCPNDANNDADNDNVCDDIDLCIGFDDNLDNDNDGIPDGCDFCVNDTLKSLASIFYGMDQQMVNPNDAVLDATTNTNAMLSNAANGFPALTTGAAKHSLTGWDFSQTNGYINIGANPSTTELGDINTTEGMTIGFWIDLDYDNSQVFSRVAGLGNVFDVVLIDEGLEFRFANESFLVETTVADNVLNGGWEHFVVTLNFMNPVNNLVLYHNGQPIQTVSVPITNSFHSNTDNLIIGAKANGSYFFPGKLDDFIIFNEGICPQEVETLYQHGAYNFLDMNTYNYAPVSKIGGYDYRWQEYSNDPNEGICDQDIVYDYTGANTIAHVPPVGVHPRIYFSPQEIPDIKNRLLNTKSGQQALAQIKAYTTLMIGDVNGNYIRSADYAVDDYGNERISNTGAWGASGGYQKLLNRDSTFNSGGYRFCSIFGLEAFETLIFKGEYDPVTGRNYDDRATDLAAALSFWAELAIKEYEANPRAASFANFSPGQLSLAYDMNYHAMTDKQRATVRKAIAVSATDKLYYGEEANCYNVTSNWASLRLYEIAPQLAIEGEEGYNDKIMTSWMRLMNSFLTHGWFDSGASYEGIGKNQQAVFMLIAASKRGFSLLGHPHLRAFGKEFLPNHVHTFGSAFSGYAPWAGCGPNKITGGFKFNISDAAGLKYTYPNDAGVDFMWRNYIDTYRGINSSGYVYQPIYPSNGFVNFLVPAAAYALDYEEQDFNTAAATVINKNWFAPKRGIVNFRSGTDSLALHTNFHCRQSNFGHVFGDKMSFTLSGLGRILIRKPYGAQSSFVHQSRFQNIVLINDIGLQDRRMPGKIIDYSESEDISSVTGDVTFAYSHEFYSTAGFPGTTPPQLNTNGWVEYSETLNDFQYQPQPGVRYNSPLYETEDWLDRNLSTFTMKRQFRPMQKVFRTMSMIRGENPFLLVVDDVQMDNQIQNYKWQIQLDYDLTIDTTIINLNNNDYRNDVILKEPSASGDRRLLVRILNNNGYTGTMPNAYLQTIYSGDLAFEEPVTVDSPESQRRLVVESNSIAPDFRVLIYPYYEGDALPTTTWNNTRDTLHVTFCHSQKVIALQPQDGGKWNKIALIQNIESDDITATVGMPCDDGDDCTINDAYNSDCKCVGERTIDWEFAQGEGTVAVTTSSDTAYVELVCPSHQVLIPDANCEAVVPDYISDLSSDYQCMQLPKPPVALWTFDETSGDTIADAIGNANGLFQYSASPNWQTGQIGGTANLAGNANENFHIDTDPLQNTQALTISTWVKLNKIQNNFKGIITSRGAGGNWGFNMHSNSSLSYMTVNGNGGMQSIHPGKWYHLALAWDNTGHVVAYLDGQKVAEENFPPTDYISNNHWTIGEDECCGGREINAQIDETAFFDTMLNEEEIAYIYRNGLKGKSILAPHPVLSQSPAAGTIISTPTSITITAEDPAGNIEQGTFNIHLSEANGSICNNETLDSDNDGVLNIDECILTSLTDAKSVAAGIHKFDFGNGPFNAYVDNDGWVLWLQYHHLGGTNPDLNIIPTGQNLPNYDPRGLDTDNSNDFTKWGHGSQDFAASIPDQNIKLRWYGVTSNHDRVIHFESETLGDFQANVNGNFVGGPNPPIQSTFTPRNDHTAAIPAITTHGDDNNGDYTLTEHPFYRVGQRHWMIRGLGQRWEVDDYYINYQANTIHRVWVKSDDLPNTFVCDPDMDGMPNLIDADSDNDGIDDNADICMGFDDNLDTDNDNIPDGCDICPEDATNDGNNDGICDNCINIQLQAYLEGAYDINTNQMTTNLQSRGLLPGQTPVSPLATPTPAGQPYQIAPWNYTGTEGAGWTNADYTGNETDWILVSFRTGTAKNTEVAQTAALLMKDGVIELIDRCVLNTSITEPLYIVLEHRNHIGIMTPQPIDIVNGVLTYDFRTSDSYRDPTSFGQKQSPTGEWMMFAGDANQMDYPSFDVNGTDKTEWFENNGVFDYYLSPDFNLDGDINGQDKSLWFENNGISSRVPK